MNFKAMAALAGILILPGCAINNYTLTTTENGVTNTTKLRQIVWFQKTAVDGLRVSPKTGFSIKSVDNETQADALAKITEAAVRGAVKGAVPVP